MELQQEIENITKSNKNLIKEKINKEQRCNEAEKRLTSITNQARHLAEGIINIMENILNNEITSPTNKDTIEKLKKIAIETFEEVNDNKEGLNFASELYKLSMIQARLNEKPYNHAINTYEVTLQPEEIKKSVISNYSNNGKAKINTKLHMGDEIFGSIMPTINASMIIANNEDHPSLLGTLTNINDELGEMSEGENIINSPEAAAMIPKKSNKFPNAMKELEELKARIMSRRRFTVNS